MSSPGDMAYCTILLTDSYLPGAMILAHSLRDNGSTAKLAALVTADTLSLQAIDELKTVYDDIIPIRRIVNHSPANLFLMGRPDLYAMFSKIELWRQLQYKQLVYIDADAVTLRAPDELLEMETNFAAAPDVGWPDCFNSGMMVLRPNLDDYNALMELAESGTSFDGADQGLLNMHFKNWDRLSFTLNCTPSAHYQYVPAFRHFEKDISIVHFIGSQKPWQQPRDGGVVGTPYQELLGHWWAVYDRHYKPKPKEERSEKRPVAQPSHREHVSGVVQITPTGEAPPHVASEEKTDSEQSAPSTTAAATIAPPPPPPYEQHQEDQPLRPPDKHVEHPISARPSSGHDEEPWVDAPQDIHYEPAPEDGPRNEASHQYQVVEEYHSEQVWEEEGKDHEEQAPYVEEHYSEETRYKEEIQVPVAYEEPPPLSIIPQHVYGEQHMRIPQVRRRPPALKKPITSAGTDRSASGRGRLSFQEGVQDQPKRFMKQRAYSPHPLASRTRRAEQENKAVEQKAPRTAIAQQSGPRDEQLPPWYPPKPKFMPPMSEWDPARGPPPKRSYPEAPNLSFANYSMSKDTQVYQAPAEYVDIKPGTKNIEQKQTHRTSDKNELDDNTKTTGPANKSTASTTETPKTVFPWEQYGRHKASRVFSPVTSATMTPSESTTPAMSFTSRDGARPSSAFSNQQFSSGDIWGRFSQQSAWDDVPEIQEYIQSLQRSHTGSIDGGPSQSLLASPSVSRRGSAMAHGPGAGRRAQLPEAAGVPRQAEWVGFTSDIFLRTLRAVCLFKTYTESKGKARAIETPPVDIPGE
ncbi:hypothetical protein KEM56_005069 [Ascosphaera pollenicola]|nr:hypothetical protein KEM56_005069 [Ascosphaera pollenicola]